MKRYIPLVVAALIALFVSSTAFAAGPAGLTGLGVYGTVGNASGAIGGGIGISLKWASFPVLGLQYNVADESTRFNASVDYYVVDGESLGSIFSYYLGAGIYGGIAASGDSDSDAAFDFGLRIPFGLQLWPIKKLELFLSPVLAVPLYPTPTLGLGLEFGGRLHF